MRAAVLGSPISHSKSPALHRAAYAAAGLDWSYDAVDVPADGLATFLAGLDDTWAGLSLTMPLKQTAAPLMAVVDPVAAVTGAVNTVVMPGAPGPGARHAGPAGYNTDVQGIVDALREAGVVRGDSMAVLGAGATARSALAAAAQLRIHRVSVYARRPEALTDIKAGAAALGIDAQVALWSHAAQCAKADIVISTVPSGVSDGLVPDLASPAGLLLDVVYDPWPTALAAAWAGAVVPGLSMLLWQAAVQVRLMTGVEPDILAMKRAVGLG